MMTSEMVPRRGSRLSVGKLILITAFSPALPPVSLSEDLGIQERA